MAVFNTTGGDVAAMAADFTVDVASSGCVKIIYRRDLDVGGRCASCRGMAYALRLIL